MSKLISSFGGYALIAVVIGGFYLFGNSGESYVEDDIDLNAVLDVTIDTIYAFEEQTEGLVTDDENPDAAFIAFSLQLEENYNAAVPKLFAGNIGVSPQNDASIYAYEDKNANKEYDEGELTLFLVEIDGENSRVIASSRSGAVNEHKFSGTGILTGYLIGSMLTRQRASGVNTKSLASKKPITAKAAARSRAGSGSHSKGK